MDTSIPGNFPNPAYQGGAPTATKTDAGTVKQAAAQADSAAAPTQGEFNGLLAKLRAAGILAAS